MMKFSLRVKMSAAFLAVTLLLFLIISVLINSLLEKQFKEYVIGKQEQKIKETVVLITQRYNNWGNWNISGIETIGVNLLGDGLILRVNGIDGNAIWDANVHNGGMCKTILEHMAQNMASYSPDFKGGYVEKRYPLTVDNTEIGSATIGYYGPYFYTDYDIRFLQTINNLLLWSAILAGIASLAFGIFMAGHLSKPIGHVIHTAKQIAKGDFDGRLRETSSTKEIVELTSTINSVAETLGKQDALRKRLTADVAHELRTPLATLQSHLEAMIDGIWQPDAARLTSCHEEIVRISKLVGDLERLTKYEGENLMLNIERFDLSAMLQRITTNFESQFKSSGILLVFEPQERMVEADEDKISQVFINLISNALKYTPSGGKVEIKIGSNAGHTDISVSDTGIGIAPEDLPQIFERFYRTDKSRSRLTGGSGIGLTIAKSIIDAHHGSITVTSEPDKGSVFTVTLPISRE